MIGDVPSIPSSNEGLLDIAVAQMVYWRLAKRSLSALLLVVLTTGQAAAWGSEGHRVIAEIAERYLEPSVARQVRELLALENVTTLSSVSTWADQIRPQRRATGPWHYVNIPITAAAYDVSRDCPGGTCVIAVIEEFSKVLADPKVEPIRRLEALKFIVHFVGDLHQPLHVTDDHDRGGNEITVTFQGRKTNLHAVWDTSLLAGVIQGDERAFSLRLTQSITNGDVSAWQAGTVIDWANDTHKIAVRTVYGSLPHEAGVLPQSYQEEAMPVAQQQLQKAGVRLSVVLNRVLK